MFALKNASLTVSVLDPVADSDRLGTRYCTGGFIFQVEDHDGTPARGNLLSGPTYPHSYNLFDGQGAPDAFQPHLVIDEEPDGTPVRLLGIGIGVIDAKANTVSERCPWDVRRAEGSLSFRTTQSARAWTFDLERTLTLSGRTLKSQTVLSNTGKRHVAFQWYPHPFFPLHPSGECCRMSVPVTFAENQGYELLDDGFLHMKHLPWTGSENHLQLVEFPGISPVSFVQKHPLTSLVTAACDYVPSRIPVWGNRFTFSFEPYYERNLQPSESARWSMMYDF